jgi:hypothetical protein
LSEHVFRVGDLVTAPRMKNWDGTLLVCRIGQSHGDDHLLLPVSGGDLPRGVSRINLTLVEAWRGPPLRRCNADASKIIHDQPD